MKKFLLASVVAASLAACGGGGSSTSSSSTSAPAGSTPTQSAIPTSVSGATGHVTSSSYTSVGDGGVGVVQVAASLVPMAALMVPSAGAATVATGDSRARAQEVAPHAGTTATALSKVVRKLGDAHALTATQASEACSAGGSITVTVDDADINNTMSAGDTVTFKYNDCNMGSGVVLGNVVMTVNTATASGGTATITFQGFDAFGEMVSGPVNVTVNANGGTTTVTEAFDDVTVLSVSSGTTSHIGITATVSDDTATGTVTSSYGGGFTLGTDSFWVSQAQPYVVPSGYALPASGAMDVQDASGARVRALGGDPYMQLEFFASGNSSSVPTLSVVGPATH